MRCPNCGSKPLLEEFVAEALWLRCLCGKLIPVVQTLEGMTIYKVDPVADRRLPRLNTKLSKVLICLCENEPSTPGELCLILKMPSDEVSTHLTILGKRGFVVRDKVRKGVKGGSSWSLTDFARKKLS